MVKEPHTRSLGNLRTARMLSFDTAPSGQFNSRPYRTYFSERRLLLRTQIIPSEFQTRKTYNITLLLVTTIEKHLTDGHILCPLDHVLRNGPKHSLHHC
jgi:hypothetical protein